MSLIDPVHNFRSCAFVGIAALRPGSASMKFNQVSSMGLHRPDISLMVALRSKGINLKTRRISSQLVKVFSSSSASSHGEAIPPATVDERGGRIENDSTDV